MVGAMRSGCCMVDAHLGDMTERVYRLPTEAGRLAP